MCEKLKIKIVKWMFLLICPSMKRLLFLAAAVGRLLYICCFLIVIFFSALCCWCYNARFVCLLCCLIFIFIIVILFSCACVIYDCQPQMIRFLYCVVEFACFSFLTMSSDHHLLLIVCWL